MARSPPSAARSFGAIGMPRRRKRGPDANDIAVGRRVRAQRLARNMTQTALGDALGITFQQVQKYEKGTNRISAGRLLRIAEVFGVPVEGLFGSAAPLARRETATLAFINRIGAMRL